MQRLALAIILLAILVGVLTMAARAFRRSLEPRDTPVIGTNSGGITMQKLAFAGLFLVILGTSTGWLGGL